MLDTVLGYLTNTVVVGVGALVVGVLFSQKIKDFFHGVPAGFRPAMKNVEAQAMADLQLAMSDVFGKYVPAVSKSTAVLEPVPSAPAPVQTGVPAATPAPQVPPAPPAA